jgi:Invasion associated locus B (IalB) protein
MNNRIYLGSIADPRRRALMKSATMLYRHSLTVALAAAIAAVCLGSNANAQAPAAPTQPAKKPPAPTAAAAPAATPAAPTAPQPTLLGQFGEWGAYTASPGGKKVCFALAKPSSSKTTPPNRPRDAAYIFISSRPSEKVRDEVSIIFGYGFKPNSDASVEIGGANYAMYTQADGAWVKNAAEETRLVDAMRKSGDLTVKGTSAKGTASVDVYSLRGLPEALNRVGQECK